MGEMVISPSFYSAGEFRNGIARVTLEYTKRSGFANHLHGYINKEGKIIANDKDRTTSLERDNHSYADGLLPVKGLSVASGLNPRSSSISVR